MIPITCPHGIIGISKCKLCTKETMRAWHKKNPTYQKDKYRRKHPNYRNMKVCPHGILGKSKCKDCLTNAARTWRLNHPNRAKELRRSSYQRRKTHCHDYYLKTRPKVKAREMKNNQAIKKIVIDHYGGKCSCCGENILTFLTIGHVNDDGEKHRKEIGGGTRFYKKLYKANFSTNYQLTVECFNCNYGKRVNHGICPHKQIKKKEGKDLSVI